MARREARLIPTGATPKVVGRSPARARSLAAVLIAAATVAGCSSTQNTTGPATTAPAAADPGTTTDMPHANPSRDQTGGLARSKSNIGRLPSTGSSRGPSGTTPSSAPPTGDELRQWASKASATSNYGPLDGDPWNASQATGAPDVDPNCGDQKAAWAAKEKNTIDTITLTYQVPVIPSELRVFQTYNPGQIVRMEMKGPSGQSKVIYEGDPKVADGCPVEGYLEKLDVGFPVDTVLITIDQSKLNTGWAEIDAVELVGKKPASTPVNP